MQGYLLSCPRARQLYLVESLHPPGHSVTAAGGARIHDQRDACSSWRAERLYVPWTSLSTTQHSCFVLGSTGFISRLGDALCTLRFIVAFLRPYRLMPTWYTISPHVFKHRLISKCFSFVHFSLLTYSRVLKSFAAFSVQV